MTLQRRSIRSAPAVLNMADKAAWVTGWNEAVDAVEAEQAQAVEPVGVVTFLPGGVRPILSRLPGARLNSGDMLYTHPAQPAGEQIDWQDMYLKAKSEKEAMAAKYEKDIGPLARVVPATGERLKVGDSQFESWYSELQQAGKSSKQIAREAYGEGLNEAQQVAVPDGWVLVPIEPTDAMCEAAWDGEGVDYVGEHKRIHRYIRMLAAAQGVKP